MCEQLSFLGTTTGSIGPAFSRATADIAVADAFSGYGMGYMLGMQGYGR